MMIYNDELIVVLISFFHVEKKYLILCRKGEEGTG